MSSESIPAYRSIDDRPDLQSIAEEHLPELLRTLVGKRVDAWEAERVRKNWENAVFNAAEKLSQELEKLKANKSG